ncbi:pirin family protein [Thalassotalea euphylliae]|uniref:Pirin family protein n=1 Tax=Thalassotalea euphylliae TaxID=1655234 RepID=A0A3E0TNX1_9GAMM|nr:pirin-like bicupin family protein [Thalassotalea euphylliae]REL26249.1 pirin family protein [Thalassotalea euphylliae]
MIKHFPFQQLGKAKHGWLTSSHHFSFAHYYNPKRMGFGTLRVVNDDWVAAGTGFAPHPHKNMEIISFIRSGAITHQDSAGNKGVTPAGEVQVMSAGTGIVHSEYNLSKTPLTFYQIWIEPNQHNVKPRWDSKRFPAQAAHGRLPILVSGYEEDKGKALFIHQEARIFGGKLARGTELEHEITHQAYILASTGSVDIIDGSNRIRMEKGDGAEVTRQQHITISAHSDAELIIIDAP